jgi:hypothetical protein
MTPPPQSPPVTRSIREQYEERRKQALAHELAELQRVGSQPFGSYLRPELIEYDVSVLNQPINPR